MTDNHCMNCLARHCRRLVEDAQADTMTHSWSKIAVIEFLGQCLPDIPVKDIEEAILIGGFYAHNDILGHTHYLRK